MVRAWGFSGIVTIVGPTYAQGGAPDPSREATGGRKELSHKTEGASPTVGQATARGEAECVEWGLRA